MGRNAGLRSRGRVAPKRESRNAKAAGRAQVVRAQAKLEMDRNDPEFKAALRAFAAASKHFHKHEYSKARELFGKVASSAARELVERARVHLALCEQRLGKPAPAPKTASDYYDLGVAKLNARRLADAIEFLNKADKADPESEHIHYALAAAHAIQGNADVALEHLKAAIDLRAGNRFQARLDEDFQALASDPRFKRLIFSGDGSNS